MLHIVAMSDVIQHTPHWTSWRHWATWLTVLVLTASVFALWRRDGERAAIARLSNDERGQLYQRTLENLRSTCRTQPTALHAYCRQQAEFILKFPECDAACQELANAFLPRATR